MTPMPEGDQGTASEMRLNITARFSTSSLSPTSYRPRRGCSSICEIFIRVFCERNSDFVASRWGLAARALLTQVSLSCRMHRQSDQRQNRYVPVQIFILA